MARYERWTAVLSAGLIFGALLACKKKSAETTPEASVSAVNVVPPPAPPPTQTSAPVETAKLGDVKRYGDKEKKGDEAAVRVLTSDLKVFNEADSKTPEVATLPKDALVFRLAEVDGFELVEFPSGVGQFSQGWVEVKGLSDKPEKVAREAVLSEKKVATVKTDGGVGPAASASGSQAAASASASASAAAKSSTAFGKIATFSNPSARAAVSAISDAQKKLKEAELRAAEAEKKLKEEEEKRKAAEKKAREAEKKATAN